VFHIANNIYFRPVYLFDSMTDLSAGQLFHNITHKKVEPVM